MALSMMLTHSVCINFKGRFRLALFVEPDVAKFMGNLYSFPIALLSSQNPSEQKKKCKPTTVSNSWPLLQTQVMLDVFPI